MRLKSWDIPPGWAKVAGAALTAVATIGGIVLAVYVQRGSAPTVVVEQADEGAVRLRLEEGLTRLRARSLMLFKNERPIRPATEAEDMRDNSTRMLALTNARDVELPPAAYLPRPIGFDGMEDFNITIFTEFHEFPSRASARDNAYILSYMKLSGAMAFMSLQLKNSDGFVLGHLVVTYDEPHQFTDVDRDAARVVARELRLLLPWLDGG